MDLGTTELTPASDGSVMVKSVEDRQLEKKEEEINPVPPTPDVDDYPDGGLAAWSIVLGVGGSAIPSSFKVY